MREGTGRVPLGEQEAGRLLAALQLAPTLGAVGVLQAKAGLVPFGHLGAVERQQVIVGEDLDAVEVPAGTGAEHGAGAWPGTAQPAQPPSRERAAPRGSEQITALKPNKAVMTVPVQTLPITPGGPASVGRMPPCPAWPGERAAPCQLLPTGHSPVALVPGPGVAPHLGSEISSSQVVDLGGEAEEAAVAVGPVHVVGGAGEAALLVGAVQQLQRPVLQVGRLLHQLGVHHQVRGIWHRGDQWGWSRRSPPP